MGLRPPTAPETTANEVRMPSSLHRPARVGEASRVAGPAPTIPANAPAKHDALHPPSRLNVVLRGFSTASLRRMSGVASLHVASLVRVAGSSQVPLRSRHQRLSEVLH